MVFKVCQGAYVTRSAIMTHDAMQKEEQHLPRGMMSFPWPRLYLLNEL